MDRSPAGSRSRRRYRRRSLVEFVEVIVVVLGGVGILAARLARDLEERIRPLSTTVACEIRPHRVSYQCGRGPPFGRGRRAQPTVEVLFEVDLGPFHGRHYTSPLQWRIHHFDRSEVTKPQVRT